MGQSKLLLPWGATTIIDRVLKAWTTSGVAGVVVVARQDDTELQHACRRWPVTVLTPDHDPQDMKQSVQHGLRHLGKHAAPQPSDGWFIAPADLPTITSEVIDSLIDAFFALDGTRDKIIVPHFGERRGHPALIPWQLTQEIFALADSEGINKIVDRHAQRPVLFSAEKMVADVDTPEQYEQLKRKTGTN
jgi:molybdenum cofactor cytidylyltransferase